MKLRYIRNLYWYDEPLLDLYIEDKTDTLYLVTNFIEKRISDENPKGVSIGIAREYDRNIIYYDDIGIRYPENFWEFKSNKDVDYYLVDNLTIEKIKDWNDALEHFDIEANIMTDEQRETLDYEFD